MEKKTEKLGSFWQSAFGLSTQITIHFIELLNLFIMKNIKINSAFTLLFLVSFSQISFAQNTDSLVVKTEFNDFDEAIKFPEKVIRLNLDGRTYKNFPKGLSKFKNLEFLSLRNDHLSIIPAEIGTLTKLKTLDLSGNDFKVFPREFSQLKNLETLYLDNDKNLDLKQDFMVLSKLPRLKELHLENDGLRVLPNNMMKLKQLESLYLNHNLLKFVPKQVKSLKNLKHLELKDNKLPSKYHNTKPNEYGLKIDF